MKKKTAKKTKSKASTKVKTTTKSKSKSKSKSKKSKSSSDSKAKQTYFHRQCHLCLVDITGGEKHECIPLTEEDLFARLDPDFFDAFKSLKDSAKTFGPQKIYNNARAVMFATRVCYMFVRPKKSYVELCFFLPREEKSASIHRIDAVSKTKFSHTVKLVHSDQVETPLTRWLKEAYDYSL